MVSTDDVLELRLRVDEMRYEADGVVSLRLVAADGGALPSWSPGAHLDLCLPSGRVRHYSLCGNPEDPDHYRVGVLREEAGRGGSDEIHSTQLVGQTLRARGPRNHFKLVDAPSYLFVAGGIGITPILPMLREAEARQRPWRLVYGGRSLASMAFLDSIGLYPAGQVAVVPESTAGRPDLAAELGKTDEAAAIYCCGPTGLLNAVQEICDRTGRSERLHFERFAADPDQAPAPATAGAEFEVHLARRDLTLTVPGDRSLLSVILDVVPDVMHDCTEGFCGTCETAVLEGTPEHHDTILSQSERDAGDTMMICVGRCKSPRLVLDL